MKAREKRRRRALRQQRKRCQAEAIRYWSEDPGWMATNHGPMYGEVGYLGEIDELLEYPCNCPTCRGELPISMQPSHKWSPWA